MNYQVPPKLRVGDQIRIITPSQSISIFDDEEIDRAIRNLEQLGLRVTLGDHVRVCDEFNSSSVVDRLTDLHQAFLDPQVNAIMAADGGFNCNQLLRSIDWDIIRHHPKIFIGYSDITALNHAILTQAGMVTYTGPLLLSFASSFCLEYTLSYFKQCLLTNDGYQLHPSCQFNDDDWETEESRDRGFGNTGFWTIHPGQAQGRIIGANLSTLALLQGTQYFPDLTDTILCLEDDYEYQIHHFDRNLQSLIHLPQFDGVKGLVIGRFESESHTDRQQIETMLNAKPELSHLPIIANVDFGHTNPKITLPIGGTMNIEATSTDMQLTVMVH